MKASFSNYGSTVYVTAPGVNVISAFPGGYYAMVSGTSFSAPLVSGTAALMVSQGLPSLLRTLGLASPTTESQVANGLTYAQPISAPPLNNRRLDSYKAVQTWRTTLGLQ